MAGSLQGPAAASLDRTPYGGGKSGGKINRPRQHINSHQDHRPLASSSTALVRKGPYDRPPLGPHASRGLASRILTGASSFISSFFRRDSAPTTPPEADDVEFVAAQVPEEAALEDVLKERAFTREQCDRLIKVLQSKMDKGPLSMPQANGPVSNGLVEDRFPEEELEREHEAREREPERTPNAMDVTGPDSSPVDLARAFMGNRLSPVPGAYPVRTLDYGVGRARDDLPRVATPGHTPYVKLRPSRIYDRPTPVPLRSPPLRERKRRVDEESDHAVRRTRMKLSNGPPLSHLPSASSNLGNERYLHRVKQMQKKPAAQRSVEDAINSVPMQSSVTAKRILDTLDTLTPPKVKSLEEELFLIREMRPAELSPSMLNEQARNTMLTIECPAPLPPLEASSRPLSFDVPAIDVPQPSTSDLKGKGITSAAEAGPSVVKDSLPPQGTTSRGFRMNTSFEESCSDDEALPSSGPAPAAAPTQNQEFTGFASESTSLPVFAPPGAPTPADISPVRVTTAVADDSPKEPETTVVTQSEKADPKPQPHPVFTYSPPMPAVTSSLFSTTSTISFQPLSTSFSIPSTTTLFPPQTPAISTVTCQSSSGLSTSSIFGSAPASVPSAKAEVPVTEEKLVVNGAVDKKDTNGSGGSALDNKAVTPLINEMTPATATNGPATITEVPTKPDFSFSSTGPAFATSTSTVPLVSSDAKPPVSGPLISGAETEAPGASKLFAGLSPLSSSSGSLFSTPTGSLSFTSSSSASSAPSFTTPSSPFPAPGSTTSASLSFGNPFSTFSSSAGGSSSSPGTGGDMDMAEEPAQTPTPAFTASTSQPFVFSSPAPTAAPATPAPSTFSSPFGSQPPLFAFGASSASSSAFGASSATSSAFGASSFAAPSVFGIGSSAPAFGASSSFGGSSGFGTSFGGSSVPGFGTSTSFGGSSAPGFGGSSAPAFGVASAPAFGGSSAPAFGGTSPAFGTSTAFGGSSASVFGTSSGFGGGSSAPAFGASTGFGASTPAFATSTSFGVSASAPVFGAAPVFSSAPPAFGGAPSAPAFGAQPFGAQPPSVGSQPAGSFGQFQVGFSPSDKERRTFRYRRGSTRRPK